MEKNDHEAYFCVRMPFYYNLFDGFVVLEALQECSSSLLLFFPKILY